MIQIVNRQKMQWEDGFRRIFPGATWVSQPTDNADLYLFMWCDDIAVDFINNSTKKSPYVVFIRRYEYYNDWIEKLDWDKVDRIIAVNDFIAHGIEKRIDRKPEVVYNSVTEELWDYKDRKHGNKIAVVGFVNQKKNFPLAMQIMAKLDESYELHIAGAVQDGATLDYIVGMANNLNKKVFFYNHIPSEFINKWLDDKNYILSCAISEGCPNNVLEAMAKGIKPIVHNWPGAKRQFGDCVFNTIEEAVCMVGVNSEYNSEKYRDLIKYRFGLNNFERLKEIVDKCLLKVA